MACKGMLAELRRTTDTSMANTNKGIDYLGALTSMTIDGLISVVIKLQDKAWFGGSADTERRWLFRA